MKRSDETRGLILGTLAVVGFSLTLPMTHIAVREFDPVITGLGRSVLSALLAGALLAWRRERWPARRHVAGLFIVALGSVIGFPLFLSYALQRVPTSHSAVVIGLLPLATALCAAFFAHERPSRRFWWSAIVGSIAVVLFVFAESGWDFQVADGLLLLSVISAAIGYAEGGRLARELEGWRVISWALVFSVPLLALPVVWSAWIHGLQASPRAWGAFIYTGVISMFLAMWIWYAGLARGGVARVSQVQLLQPFLTIGWAALLLGEHISRLTFYTTLIVIATVAAGRSAIIHRRPQTV